jgi:hypothetical protein
MSRCPVKRDGHASVFRLAGMLLVLALITAIFVHGLPSSQWIARDELCQCAGYLASALVLATFAMKNMRLLRITAILSNIAFITYGALQWLPPVIGLHVLLLPINLVRLIELHRAGRNGQPHQLSWAARSPQSCALRSMCSFHPTRLRHRRTGRGLV